MAKKSSVEIVIPIYNEEEELSTSIRKLHAYLTKNLSSYKWNITIADNASIDNSLAIANNLGKTLLHISVVHINQKGRGKAVKKVWLKSNCNYLIYMDVDLSTDLLSLKPLISSLENGYDIAIGSRLLPESKVSQRPLKREILSRVYNILIKIGFQTNFSDAQCGFKAMTKRAAHQLLPRIADNAWFFDSELLIVAEKSGYRIFEVPVKWVDNPGSTVRVLGTVKGDLLGLWRLICTRPWRSESKKYEN